MDLDNYFGTLNEIRLGTASKPAPKPEALIAYEQTKEFGIPLVDGGIVDQPHIWIEQYAAIMNREKLWKRMLENATRPSK